MFDESVAANFAVLEKVADGGFSVTDRTLDDTTWLIVYEVDDGPARTYRYDRTSKHATFLFTHRSELQGLPLAHMFPVAIPARDGLELVSYLTLPTSAEPDSAGKPKRPVPMVLWVHGGPWSRDEWGFDAIHQRFANRGQRLAVRCT